MNRTTWRGRAMPLTPATTAATTTTTTTIPTYLYLPTYYSNHTQASNLAMSAFSSALSVLAGAAAFFLPAKASMSFCRALSERGESHQPRRPCSRALCERKSRLPEAGSCLGRRLHFHVVCLWRFIRALKPSPPQTTALSNSLADLSWHVLTITTKARVPLTRGDRSRRSGRGHYR
jgi:hypothetical protein